MPLPLNEVIHGDCLAVMRGLSSGSIDLIYIDPPFNTGRDFGDYADKWPSTKAYLDFIRPRVKECRRLLKPTGSFWLHCDSKANHHLRIMLDEVFGVENFRNEAIWFYTTTSSKGMRWFPRRHDTIYWFSKTADWVFNRELMRTPYKNPNQQFAAARRGQGVSLSAADKKALRERGKVIEDVWYFPPAVRYPAQRQGYATQKPLGLLSRIITATSNPGDIVLDAFCGSGTALVAAKQLERRFVGIDCNPRAVELSRKRLAEMML